MTRMPTWLDPQLATLTHERFSDPDWIYERKLDGERCLAFAGADGVRLLTRNKHDISTTFPEIAKALADAAREEVVMDGEIVAFEGSATRFSRLQQRLGLAVVREQDMVLAQQRRAAKGPPCAANRHPVRAQPDAERPPVQQQLATGDPNR